MADLVHTFARSEMGGPARPGPFPARGRAGAELGKRPLRLLHVFTRFNIGGAQVRFATLAEALGPEFSHTVISLLDNYEAAQLLPPFVAVDYASPPRATSLPAQLWAYRRLLAELKPDLLLTYNWGAIEFALANMLGGRRHLHLEDGFGPEEATGQLRRRVWMRRLALARSHLAVPSRTLKTLAEHSWRMPARRVHYIPNAVPPLPRRSGPRFMRTGAPVRIAWTGALRPEKNPLRLLEAFAPLKAHAQLMVIGDGPERPAVEAEVKRLGLGDAVRLLGRRDDAREIMAGCDLLALSSDTEQMPLVVLEAMDAGLPVASVDVGDVRHMVSAENSPFVVPRSAFALGAALSRLTCDPELRRRIGEANRRRADKVFPLSRMVEAHRSLLRQLAA